jgi:adenylosuccinate lyase
MRRNLESSGGLIYSGNVLLALAERGVTREQAYEWVQSAAMTSRSGGGDFRALLKANPEVTRVLPASDIDRCFDLDHQLRHVDHLFRKVFGRA